MVDSKIRSKIIYITLISMILSGLMFPINCNANPPETKSNRNWVEYAFYKNYTMEKFHWYYNIIPELYFQPDPAFAPQEEMTKDEKFFFSGGEMQYHVNPRVAASGYMNFGAHDSRVGFQVEPNGSLSPFNNGQMRTMYFGR